jgi:hypothetical protein
VRQVLRVSADTFKQEELDTVRAELRSAREQQQILLDSLEAALEEIQRLRAMLKVALTGDEIQS